VTHKFDVKNKHRLDNAKRRLIFPPFDLLTGMGLKEGDAVADIGCGIGYFTFPASEIVGGSGKVYAMDISLEMLEEVDRAVEENIISNVVTISTRENDLEIPSGAVNYALISNVLHETECKEKFLSEVNRILANDGSIGIVEWRRTESEFGPPLEHRLDKEYIRKLLQDIGFRDIHTKDIGEYFYTVTGKK
jgi:ubiquinone/menaquinone biosynthesis C-methylase UbiE